MLILKFDKKIFDIRVTTINEVCVDVVIKDVLR